MMDNNNKRLVTIVIICVVATSISITALLRLGFVNRELSDKVDALTNSVDLLESRMEDVELSEIEENDYLYYSKQISDFYEYLLFLKDHVTYTAFIVVKDIQGHGLTTKQVDILSDMGFEDAEILLEHEYHSFIGVVQDGKAVYQQLGGDEDITYSLKIGSSEVFLESATFNAGNQAVISIDGADYAIGGRAFNIVLVRTEDMRVVDSVCFDTHSEEALSSGRASAIR